MTWGRREITGEGGGKSLWGEEGNVLGEEGNHYGEDGNHWGGGGKSLWGGEKSLGGGGKSLGGRGVTGGRRGESEEIQKLKIYWSHCTAISFEILYAVIESFFFSSSVLLLDMEAVSSMQTSGWPVCVSHGQPHQPTNLVLAQIIPANGKCSCCAMPLNTDCESALLLGEAM